MGIFLDCLPSGTALQRSQRRFCLETHEEGAYCGDETTRSCPLGKTDPHVGRLAVHLQVSY